MTYRFTFLGLSITSSWGNGHATTYRALLRALADRGHEIVFLERDLPFYAANRDLADPPYARTILYGSLEELYDVHRDCVSGSDMVVVGSYVPEGSQVGNWACEMAPGRTAFYDIDTPVTLAKLDRGDHEYISRELVARYALYLSFAGGPTLRDLERTYGSPRARALYCAVDAHRYGPISCEPTWDLGYLGTFSEDRQSGLERFLVDAARARQHMRFVVAGSQYPASFAPPENVHRIDHLASADHPGFYCSQRFTLNLTRAAMRERGWSPSVRLFEAGACGTAVISDDWPGLEELFIPGQEIVLARSGSDVLRTLDEMPERERVAIGARMRQKVLAAHTAEHRAEELETHTRELLDRLARVQKRGSGGAERSEAAE